MSRVSRFLSVLPVVAAYFVAASISATFDRFSGGVPFLWAGTAIIIADLRGRSRRCIAVRMAGFFLASILATTLFGRGAAAALPVGFADLLEGGIAAYLLSIGNSGRAPIGSLAWLTGFVVPVGIIAPAIVGAWMAAGGLLTGLPPLGAIPGIVAGHAMGNILLTPLAMLVRRGGVRALGERLRSGQRRREALLLLLLVVLVTAAVFSQQQLPLLFLPILPLILVSFRMGHGASGVAVVIVAVIGTAFTLAGMGPVMLVHATAGGHLLFLQFYFASTVLTALPVAADLEHRQQLYRTVRLSEERYRLFADHSTDMMMHMDVAGRTLYVSPSVTQLTGYRADELLGFDGIKLVADDHLPSVIEAHRRILAARGATHVFEYVACTATGEPRWFEAHARAILDSDGAVDGVLSIVRDVTARKEMELRLSLAALTDPLTGLGNRRAFEEAAERRCSGAGQIYPDCVAVFDIDHFKRVNDVHGHDAGDAVLRSFAQVMRRAVRAGDVVARTGGEEFAILFPATAVEHALIVCNRVRAEMAATTTDTGGALIRVTVSGGIATVGPRGLDRALKEADQALYTAKRGGRDQLALAA